MGKKKTGNTLGRSLMKDKKSGSSGRKGDSLLHTADLADGYDWGRLNLQSVTEENSLHEFLSTAELAGTEFVAEKLNVTFVNPKSNIGLLSKEERVKVKATQDENKHVLKIPRRPVWNENTTAEELDRTEKDEFLKWRRSLAELQEVEGVLLTPYEKNLEFWRQLWRVIERSDVVVQIVDARNPLLFRCEDLEKYVKELDSAKLNMILANKADFLTEEQRWKWARYFDSIDVRVAFFSATQDETGANKNNESIDEEGEDEEEELGETKDGVQGESTAQNCEETTAKKNSAEDDISKRSVEVKDDVEELCKTEDETTAQNSDEDEEDSSWDDISDSEEEKIVEELCETQDGETTVQNSEQSDNKVDASGVNSGKLLTREELITLFKSIHKGKKVQGNITTIGLVGYPNVGKSSTINTLLTFKKVSVSATPGKTKHFQTLYLDTDLMLCDCPGLVMPTFVFTKAEMIINGILPIDQMKDHVPPTTLVASMIPRHVLCETYGIILPLPIDGEDPKRPPTSDELLSAYGYNRGFMTQRGLPDNSRAARYILKHFVNGKLLYCHAPPGYKQEEFHTFREQTKPSPDADVVPPQNRVVRPTKISSKELNQAFFQKMYMGVHTKGRICTSGTPSSDRSSREDPSGQSSTEALNSKPWKKHYKGNTREKLRRVYRHLDQ